MYYYKYKIINANVQADAPRFWVMSFYMYNLVDQSCWADLKFNDVGFIRFNIIGFSVKNSKHNCTSFNERKLADQSGGKEPSWIGSGTLPWEKVLFGILRFNSKA